MLNIICGATHIGKELQGLERAAAKSNRKRMMM
jgi:hypothetical protein